MTVQDFDKFMELNKLLNHTWGTGSQFLSLTDRTVRFRVLDDKKLQGTVTMIVNFPNEPARLRDMREKHKDDTLATMKSAIKELASKFKEETGKSIKLTLVDDSVDSNVEFLSTAQYRPVLPAYFRLNCFVEVS